MSRAVSPPHPSREPPGADARAAAGPASLRPAAQLLNTLASGQNLPTATQARLSKALRRLSRQPRVTRWCEVSCVSDLISHWRVHFYFAQGAMATSLRRHRLDSCVLEVMYPPDYPQQPPQVRVTAPHIAGLPGTVFGGALCLEFLHKWNPATDEEAMLLQLHHAFSEGTVVGKRGYGRWEARYGDAHIRSSHPDWRPQPPAPVAVMS